MQNINVALANIRLDFDNRTEFIEFLRISYEEKV